MATLIERIVEPVIEDPVVDILAEPGKESAVAGLAPALKLGPVSRRGTAGRAGDGVLPEAAFSDASDPGQSAADSGNGILSGSANFSNPPGSGSSGQDGSDPGPFMSPSYDSVPPPQNGDPPSEDGGDNGEGDAPDAPGDSDSETPPGEVPDDSGGSEPPAETGGDEPAPGQPIHPDPPPGATVFGTDGDDMIDVAFVFPDDVRTEPGTLYGTTHKADVVDGNGGDDAVNGGGGADRFVFDDASESPAQAPDLVFDFDSVQGDRIDVSGIDAISDTVENEEFIFIGDDTFSGSAGELRFVQDHADGLLEGDVNGDATADFTIELLGVTSFTGDDILGIG